MRAALLLSFVAAACTSASARDDGDTRATAPIASPTGSTIAFETSSSTLATPGPATASASAAAPPLAPSATASASGVAWAQKLSPLVFRDVNTLFDVTMRLYRDDGTIDESAAAEVERVLWIGKDEPPSKRAPSPPPEPPHVSRRLLQLVVKAAEHFGVHEVTVISSHRGKARKGSRHRSGEAIDFLLAGVPPKQLAELLRTYPRVGVGVYIHPRSQFVHLDVRDQSYHWIDSSPPGRTWREHALPDPTAKDRDAAYTPSQDLPDGAL